MPHKNIVCQPFLDKFLISIPLLPFSGGVETGSMYVQYVQGVKPNVPARTTFIEIYIDSSRAVCRIGLSYGTNLSK